MGKFVNLSGTLLCMLFGMLATFQFDRTDRHAGSVAEFELEYGFRLPSPIFSDVGTERTGTVKEYFICLESLTLIEVNWTLSKAKSRCRFLFSVAGKENNEFSFRKISADQLTKAGIKPNSFMSLGGATGMGSSDYFRVVVREDRKQSLREVLTIVLKEGAPG